MKLDDLALASTLILGIRAQSCSTTDCTTACLLFDTSWNTCNFDWPNKGFDSLTSCLCRWNGLATTVGALGSCTACQKDGLASHSLATYQYYGVICNTYLTEGEAVAASAVAYTPTATVLDVFSSVYLPVIERSLCHQLSTSSSITTPLPQPVTSSSGSSTSHTPTPNLAAERFGRTINMLAIPAVLNLMIG